MRNMGSNTTTCDSGAGVRRLGVRPHETGNYELAIMQTLLTAASGVV